MPYSNLSTFKFHLEETTISKQSFVLPGIYFCSKETAHAAISLFIHFRCYLLSPYCESCNAKMESLMSDAKQSGAGISMLDVFISASLVTVIMLTPGCMGRTRYCPCLQKAHTDWPVGRCAQPGQDQCSLPQCEVVAEKSFLAWYYIFHSLHIDKTIC